LEELRRAVGHSRWTLHETATVRSAMSALAERAAVVLICEIELPDGTWRDLLAHAHALPLDPPVIVVGRKADDRLWMEVLDRGGYNLLGLPLDEPELFRVVSLAWRQLRDRAKLGRRTAGR
jgi:DNA-binding NtrC family response regulator